MSAVIRIRLGLLLAAGVLFAGCGRETPSPLGATKSQAPRRIQLPANIRPLVPDRAETQTYSEAGSIPVQYQQPQWSADSRPTSNVVLSAGAQTNGVEPVREPSSPPALAANEAPAAPPNRSQFIPISMPQPSAAPAAPPVPSLPESANFVAAVRAVTAASAGEGPQLTGPIAAAPSSPDASQPAPPAEATQPRSERWMSAPVAAAALPESHDRPVTSPASASQEVAIYSAPLTTPQRPLTAQPLPVSNALQAVAQRALQMSDHASATAERGMFFSARSELLQSLQLIAQALDVQEGNAHHATALAAGLTALEEARDFNIGSNRPGNAVQANAIAANHRTLLLRDIGAAPISPVVAQQQYFGYAQSQFVLASGGVPAASQILYRLGRLQTAMAAHDADPLALHAPQSIVFHQAALATDGGNWLAANELGVLYARYGQLAEARQLLVYSVTVHPHVEGWHNLAVVHRRLGEADLAQRAEAERQLLVQKAGKSAEVAGDMVRWIDPKSFAASGSRDVQLPAEQRYAVTPAGASTPTRR